MLYFRSLSVAFGLAGLCLKPDCCDLFDHFGCKFKQIIYEQVK